MTYLERYLQQIKHSEICETVKEVSTEIFDEHLKGFDYKSHSNGLLLGEVQSGKTGQMFGVISRAIDNGFDLFIVVTTDNNKLQEQTFTRALESFPDLCVCSESDSIRFTSNKMIKPLILILKKNVSVLKKWRNHLSSSNYLSGRSLFIIDDEADAASLNTKVNQNDISAINKHLSSIRDMASSCIYLQVTATPQAVILQSIFSGFKPSFITYFKPGREYLGGDFFFSKPASFTIRYTDDNELNSLRDENEEIGPGLASAVLCYLVVTAHLSLTKSAKTSNFLIHPSVRVADHAVIAIKIGEYLNDILNNFEDDIEIEAIKSEYSDLYKSKPEIRPFNQVLEKIRDLLFNSEIKISTLNSKTEYDFNFNFGFNIIVGGNTLGRGVTFPMLQVVYYSRTSKTPQADTYWQHCRMFGYERDRGLIRIFMPRLLYKLFQDLNNSQNALIHQILSIGLDETHLYHLNGIKPTRKNVIETEKLSIINGGVNYFPELPQNKSYLEIDNLLKDIPDTGVISCHVDLILSLISEVRSELSEDWDSKAFYNAVRIFSSSNNINEWFLMVRRNRQLRKSTGTMLSENDRVLCNNIKDRVVLVMYRITGEKELGWNDHPLWIPNIKLPEGNTFYRISE
jgi:hypothetical protein